MEDPNLIYRKDGQRECKACKDARNKKANEDRKAFVKQRGPVPRKPRFLKPRNTIKRQIIARGGL